jgi:CubicO group peptidase (beta-lactamase class C family)
MRLSYSLTLIVVATTLNCAAPSLHSDVRDVRTTSEVGQIATFADPDRLAKLSTAFPAIDERLRTTRSDTRSPGLAVGIVVDGRLVWAKGYGVRDVASRAPVESNTVFRIFSITKTITAMAILQLRDAGLLALDEPAEKYVPELKSLRYPTSDTPPITIRELLTHDAGLPHFTPSLPTDETRGLSETDILAGLRNMPLARAPGIEYQYSSLGFSILGIIISRVSGMPYRDYVAQKILRPLGMTSTTFESENVPRARLALGYDDSGVTVDGPKPFGADAPEGGLFSSIEDLARYAAFQLSAWPPRSDSDSGPLRRSSVRETHHVAGSAGMWVRQRADGSVRASVQAIGLGWGVRETCDVDRLVTHNGGDRGYHSAIYLLPDYGVGIVTLANGQNADDEPAKDTLALLLKSGGLIKRTLPPSPAFVVARDRTSALLERWDDSVARSTFGWHTIGWVRESFAKLHRDHGACHFERMLEVKSPFQPSWRLACERGAIELEGGLMTSRPAFEGLDIWDSFPPSAHMASIEAALVPLLDHWDQANAESLFATRAAAEAFGRTAARAGACKVERMLEGNGQTEALFALECGGRTFRLDIALDGPEGKVRSAEARERSKCPTNP